MTENMRSCVKGLMMGSSAKKSHFAKYPDAVILAVEKISVSSDDGETYYENEPVVLLDIYPKTNGRVSITYGGLTKTVVDTSGAESPNAQQVFFGIFHGVSDEVETPDNGMLTIKGDYETFAISTYHIPKIGTSHCPCITGIFDFGEITSIPAGAFYGCYKITSATIPLGVKSIGYQAFYGCSGMNSVVIPNGVTRIGSWAFYNCYNLTDVTIPEGVGSIEYMTFARCSKLTEITIPRSVTEIHNRAFDGTVNLNLIISADNEHYTFNDGILFNKDKTVLCIALHASDVDTLTIPDTVTEIAIYAVYGRRSNLTSITIPYGVTSIGAAAFYGCSKLTGVTFENTSGWYVTDTENGDASTGTAVDVTDPTNNVTLLTDTYDFYYWYRS